MILYESQILVRENADESVGSLPECVANHLPPLKGLQGGIISDMDALQVVACP